MDEEELPPLEHRHQSRGVEAGEQDVLGSVRAGRKQPVVGHLLEREVALVVRPWRLRSATARDRRREAAAEVARFPQSVAEQDVRGGPASAGLVRSGLAHFDELEGPSPRHRLHVVA